MMKLSNNILSRTRRACTNLTALSLILSSFFLSSCSDKEVKDPGNNDIENNTSVENKYIISFQVSTPNESGNTRSETRSTTEPDGSSSDGELLGTDPETQLISAQVFFLVDGNVVASYETDDYGSSDGKNLPNYKIEESPVKGGDYTHLLQIEVDIQDMKKLAGNDVTMILIGNHERINDHGLVKNGDSWPSPISRKFTASGLNATPIEDFGTEGTLMPLMNAKEFKLPDDGFKSINKNADDAEILQAIRKLFTSKAFNGGDLYPINQPILQLERGVARVDYKDRDTKSDLNDFPSTGTYANQKHVYQIGNSKAYMVLDHMQIFNVNKSSNLIRQTIEGTNYSAFGVGGKSAQLWGNERGTTANQYNWIVGADWTNSGRNEPDFLNKLSVDTETFAPTGIISTGTTDTEKGIINITTLDGRTPQGGYQPWRYITENTTPKVDMMDLENLPKYATGVAFTFRLLNKDGEDLAYSAKEEKYPTAITKSTTTGAGERTITITMPDDGVWQDVDENNGKYYLTYYAFLVHNDQMQDPEETPEPGEDGEMTEPEQVAGPMRHGVVRNNVYQISITKVDNLPDPKDPKTLYLQLDIKVLPWTVRRNSFTF